LYWSQISKIVFGASDEHRGFVKWEHNYIQNRRKTGVLGRSFRLDEALLLLKGDDI
jgi:tRNA(Arg) A34 adenosine deaminase TadA